MIGQALTSAAVSSVRFTDELAFLRQHTGEDEATLLIQALHSGLNMLYQQAVEQLFIDDEFSRNEAVNILGRERVAEIEYAKQALAQDIFQGYRL